jgi:ATP-dependent Clp protease adaptor protein ClpS
VRGGRVGRDDDDGRVEPGPQPVATETLRPPRTRERPRTGGGAGSGFGCRVVVLNDDHNTFEGVAALLSSVLPGVSYQQGLRLADRIHFLGSAVVWSGAREVGELYWQQLHDGGLTMAPLEG